METLGYFRYCPREIPWSPYYNEAYGITQNEFNFTVDQHAFYALSYRTESATDTILLIHSDEQHIYCDFENSKGISDFFYLPSKNTYRFCVGVEILKELTEIEKMAHEFGLL